jgi:protocatechuate 3,4-dioxygenase beta subunit
MVDPKEPGERLIVTGTVTGPDGKTPVHGASVYVFHVDAAGRYEGFAGTTRGDEGSPRLRGYMRSDANGHYTYTTIRPAPYIDRGGPEHIHYILIAQGYKTRGGEMYFTDDPQFQPSETDPERRGPHAMRVDSIGVCQPTKNASGAWHCTMDIEMASN